jgi:hypothetical protein
LTQHHLMIYGRPPWLGFSLYRLVCVSPWRIEWYSSISQQLSRPALSLLLFLNDIPHGLRSRIFILFYFILFCVCVCVFVCWEWAKETNAQQSGPVLVTSNFNFNIFLFLGLEFWFLMIVIDWNWICILYIRSGDIERDLWYWRQGGRRSQLER